MIKEKAWKSKLRNYIVGGAFMSGLQENQKSTSAQNAIAPIGIKTGFREIPLTQGKVAIVDDEDYQRVSEHKWCANKSRYLFYATRSAICNGKKITLLMHRFILNLAYGDKTIVDHINQDSLDNRKSNLRIATTWLNSYNCKMQRHNTSGYRGVTKYKNNRWEAYIKVGGEQKHCGYYSTPVEAALAHDVASLLAFGNDAMINFPIRSDI